MKTVTMRCLATGILAAGLLAQAGCASSDECCGSGQDSMQVVKVIDGDTVELEDGTRVRYLGVDTPELSHSTKPNDCFAEQAAEFNESLVLYKTVWLEYDKEEKDMYGRTLAYVYVSVGGKERMVNEEIVRKGYGKVLIISPNDKYEDLLKEAELHAQSDGAGLWSLCP